MAKQKKARKLTPFTKILCLVLIIFSGFLIYSSMKEVMTTLQLRKDVALAQAELEKVKDENQ